MNHNVKIIKLEKGAELLIVNVPNSTMFGFGVSVRAGSNYAPRDKIELAHLTEHMMFNGNRNFLNQDDFSFELEKNGTYYNAHTSPISVDFIYNFGADDAARAIELAFSQINGPIFTEKALRKEKKTIRRELEPILDNPYEECFYNHHNVISEGVFSARERIKILRNISLRDVLDYYKKFYVAENTKFVLYGSFKSDQEKMLMTEIKKGLIGMNRGNKQPLKFPKLKDYKGAVTVKNSKKAERYCYEFSFVNPDYDISISAALKVFYSIYNDGTYSRMLRKVRREGTGYGFRGGYSIGRDYSEFYIFDKSPLNHSLVIFEMAIGELKNLMKGSFTEDEYQRAVGYTIGNMERAYQTAKDIAKWYVRDFLLDEPLEDLSRYIKNIRTIPKEEIIEAANKFIKTENWVFSLLGPDAKKRAKDYLKIIQAVE